MTGLPPAFADWFARQGWAPHRHQLALLAASTDCLLIAPTGGGKTLAGFLPSLVELGAAPPAGLHTLYISPLKALAVDVARNLLRPIAEIGLEIRVEDRTGDSSPAKRRRQRMDPPQILLTTPESLALMLSYPEAPRIFGSLKRVVIDELHALAESKRGDQLMLGLARLRHLMPELQVTGLSATVEDPAALAAFMGGADILMAAPGPAPDVAFLPTRRPAPWAGRNGRYAVPDILAAVAAAESTIIFVNTRAQAELMFQALWLANEAGLPIGLHHGSLSTEQRGRVEMAMAAGELRAVVATGSLDLGIDWGNVDLVIQIGSPRQVKRLVQRIGRSHHRLDLASRARLVPTHRFEIIECAAAIAAVEAGDLDGDPRPPGPLEVLCQHILLTACAAPFDADLLYHEVRSAGPYAGLSREDFDACLDLAATGGYALRAYDRWQRLMLRDGLWSLRDPRAAQLLRMNIGTIVQAELVKVWMRGRGGGSLGEIEESFAAALSPGDTFLIAGRTVRYDRMHELVVEVTPQPAKEPKIAAFSGQILSTSVALSARVLSILASPARRAALPAAVQAWLTVQAERSALPQPGQLLCETFPEAGQWCFVLYAFAGRNAHQSLGLVLSRWMEQAGLAPLRFVVSDHALLITTLHEVTEPQALSRANVSGPEFAEWLAGTSLMRRSFRNVATIAGLILRNAPGRRKTGKQATFSSDIIFDTLRKHDPGHVLLRATAADLQHGLLDLERMAPVLAALATLSHHRLDRVSPFAAPLLMEMGRVRLSGSGAEEEAARLAARLMQEAGLSAEGGMFQIADLREGEA